jgi:hypothetical protein
MVAVSQLQSIAPKRTAFHVSSWTVYGLYAMRRDKRSPQTQARCGLAWLSTAKLYAAGLAQGGALAVT